MHDQFIAGLQRRFAAVLMLKHALLWLAAWAFFWGTFVIVWRVAIGEPADDLWWGLTAAPLLAIAAAGLAVRGVPSRANLRAVVDRSSRCGGLLMAAAETRLGPWQQAMPEPAPLQVRWRGGRAWLTFVTGVAFLLVAMLFPQALVSSSETPLDISQEAQQLAAQLDVLKQEAVLEPQRAETLKERLQQLKDDAKGTSPVKTLEALDHLRDIAKKAAKEGAEAALTKSEKLGQAEGLADGIRKNEGELDPKVEKEAFAALAGLVQKAAAETNLLDKHLDPELLKKLAETKLSAEQLKKLAEALKGSKLDISKMLGNLIAVKLIDVEFLLKCEAAGKCDCAAMLKSDGGKMKVSVIVAKCGIPGKGGVNEGPGSSPITWSHDTKEDGTKFKEETLPPAGLAKLKESMVIGVGQGDPQGKQPVAPSQGGALANAAAGGGSANAQVILPRHKQAVEKYFLRPAPKN
jgi:hypothetical protein